MTASKDTVDLTRVGPGTVMGEFMRQYWIPAAMSSELNADGAPMRLPLLGEKLIAFRDTDGRVGVMDHRCPHRGASLFLGRNEDGGLRCVYHGWKFDVGGKCVDMPSVSEGERLKDRYRAKAYPAAERGGLIWVYMGPREVPPPLPDVEATMLDAVDVDITMCHRDCNWLQSLEGDIDTAHFGFLHAGTLDPDEVGPKHPFYGAIVSRIPKYEVSETNWGTSYGAYRSLPTGEINWRTAHFMFPFWTQIPQGDFKQFVHARAWVPIDDERTMHISIAWKVGRREITQIDLGPGYGFANNYLPNTSDWYGRWRLAENEGNDWMIDREAQRSGQSFTGIDNIQLQDQAVTESMGAITDHSWEHLTSADLMISRTRRRLLRAARDFADTGIAPPGVDNPEIFMEARAGYFLSATESPWRPVYDERMKDIIRPVAARQAEVQSEDMVDLGVSR